MQTEARSVRTPEISELLAGRQPAPYMWTVGRADRRLFPQHVLPFTPRSVSVVDGASRNVTQMVPGEDTASDWRPIYAALELSDLAVGTGLRIVGKRRQREYLIITGNRVLGIGVLGGIFGLGALLNQVAAEAPVPIPSSGIAYTPGIDLRPVPTRTTQEIIVPTRSAEPTITASPTVLPDVFERFYLQHTSTPEAGMTSLSPYARYQVGGENGEIVQGYTQQIQPGSDGAMRYVLNPDTLRLGDRWPAYGQVYGAWPFPPVEGPMRLVMTCSGPCVVRIVDATNQTVLETQTSRLHQDLDGNETYRVYREFPEGIAGRDLWVTLEPEHPGSREPLSYARLELGVFEDPEIVLPHGLGSPPVITGATEIPAETEEEAAARLTQVHVAVGKRVGRAEQWWQDAEILDDGRVRIRVPINRERMGLALGDPVTARIIAPVALSAGYHDVQINCDDACTVSFISRSGVVLDQVKYRLEDREQGETRDGDYRTATVYLGVNTYWIVIDHDDVSGGWAGVDLFVQP